MDNIKRKEPQVIFDRMKELMNEMLYLTDVVEDEQFETNQEALQDLAADYTQLFDIAMSRGLVLDEEGIEMQEQPSGSPDTMTQQSPPNEILPK